MAKKNNKTTETSIDLSSCYVNRELSWLKFNERVLEEAEDERNPLLERLNFLSIYQSNLDEFFMVRIGGLHDTALIDPEAQDSRTAMTAKEQLDAVLPEIQRLAIRRDAAFTKIMRGIRDNGIRLVTFDELTHREQSHVRQTFEDDIQPLLFPAILGKKQPFPFLKNKEVYVFAVLETKSGKRRIAIVPTVLPMFPRTIELSGLSAGTSTSILPVENVILHFIGDIFPDYTVKETSLIRIVRNADIDEARVYDEELDYRDHMSEVIKRRKKLSPVRLDISRELSEETISALCSLLRLDKRWVFLPNIPLSMDFTKPINELLGSKPQLKYKPRTPQLSPEINDGPMIPQIMKKDILLHYPYESITPFLNLLRQASEDKNVVSIQMTLYRLASHSKVIEALVDAAENGKEVNVLVELKARFDEENNINWSKRLEQAGCRVVYGIDGLKVHSKICLITRKSGKKITYITQIGTGNYNETTSRFYTDLSLMTADKELGIEISDVFRHLLIGETVTETNHFMIAPNCLQNKMIDLIDGEIAKARNGKQAYIGLKLNSLTDRKIMEKLIEASQSGVKTEMIVRGICCLKPGIPGMTENIRIISIVGRLLEHSRIYIFGKNEDSSVFISSADMMTRNTLKRVEVAAPIRSEELKERIINIFDLMLQDTSAARLMLPDGNYKRLREGADNLCAQEELYDMAYKNAENSDR